MLDDQEVLRQYYYRKHDPKVDRVFCHYWGWYYVDIPLLLFIGPFGSEFEATQVYKFTSSGDYKKYGT